MSLINSAHNVLYLISLGGYAILQIKSIYLKICKQNSKIQIILSKFTLIVFYYTMEYNWLKMTPKITYQKIIMIVNINIYIANILKYKI